MWDYYISIRKCIHKSIRKKLYDRQENMAKVSAEEKVYHYLLGLLIEHKLQPGSRILEKEIVEKIKVSRTPVRNAIIKLVADGLLDKAPDKGVTIPIPTGEDVKQIFCAREALEGESAFLAAMSINNEDIDFLKMLHKREKDAYYSFNKKLYTEVNESFHLNIARISKNRYLDRFIKQVYWRSQIFVFYFDSFYNFHPENSKKYFTPYERSSFKDHSEIIDAIINHDAGIAKKRMREHISSTYNLLFKPWQKNI